LKPNLVLWTKEIILKNSRAIHPKSRRHISRSVLLGILLTWQFILTAACEPDVPTHPTDILETYIPDATMGSHAKLDLKSNTAKQEITVCPDGETVYGIDVSKWQGDINWPEVASGGVEYAFIRVSDGLNYFDEKFAQNWEGARANGILRGSYQFFRSDEDPVAQANLLLDTMGPLEPGDLPPVIDVESTDGQSPATIAANVGIWIDHVENALGVQPIIYSGKYFWQDNVQSDAFSEYPLWIPNWGVSCPNIQTQWSEWSFWQISDNGSIPGISGDVDEDLFNGNIDDLYAFAVGEPVCGDGYCTGAEAHETCPEDCPICENIPEEGRIIDDDDLCFLAGGAAQYIRHEDDAGYGGALKWSKTWVTDEVENYGHWLLNFDEPGDYLVEVYTDGAYAEWADAKYEILHDGNIDVVTLDQTAVDGWQELGEFNFTAHIPTGDGQQWLYIEDRVDDEAQAGMQFVLDAIRITPLFELDAGVPDNDAGEDDGGSMVADGGEIGDEDSGTLDSPDEGDGGSGTLLPPDRNGDGDGDGDGETPVESCACQNTGASPISGLLLFLFIALKSRRLIKRKTLQRHSENQALG
jgi:GH25 family lysozyme M1 (1,4-beta-N-acetylmuramidase)